MEVLEIDEDVFGFEVPENEVPFVDVLDGQNDLAEDLPDLLYRKQLLPVQVVEQIAVLTVVQNEDEILLKHEVAVELDDIFMIQLFVDLDFLLQKSKMVLVEGFGRYYLQSVFLTVGYVQTFEHSAEGSLSNLLDQREVVD